jgi:hypothetical protein
MALCYGVQPKDPLLHSIYDAAVADPVYQSIVTAIKRGKLVAKLQKGHPGKSYKSVWDKISVLYDAILVINATQIVVPIKLRHQILKQLHEPHAGINRTRALARKHFYWPGLSTDIAAMINNCDKCQFLRPSQAAEPLQCQPKPVEPMQSVSMDLYEVRGRHFLVMCDRYSYFCWTAQLHTQKSSTVIKIIDTWFHGVGFPQYIFSDSGPQFGAAEFKEYCKEHYITPFVSSACFPQSNGLAESAIKSAKYLLLKSENYMDFENKLYEMQNIPSSGDTLSPAKKFSNVGLGPICPPWIPFSVQFRFMKVEENVLRLVIEYVYKMQFQNVGMILGQSAKFKTAVDRIILTEIRAEIPFFAIIFF